MPGGGSYRFPLGGATAVGTVVPPDFDDFPPPEQAARRQKPSRTVRRRRVPPSTDRMYFPLILISRHSPPKRLRELKSRAPPSRCPYLAPVVCKGGAVGGPRGRRM